MRKTAIIALTLTILLSGFAYAYTSPVELERMVQDADMELFIKIKSSDRTTREEVQCAIAIISRDFETADSLLTEGANVIRFIERDGVNFVNLIGNGRIEALRYMLNHGLDPNFKVPGYSTLLHEAARLGKPEIVSLLIDQGADVNAKDNYGTTPLMLVATGGVKGENIDRVIDILLEHEGVFGVVRGRINTFFFNTVPILETILFYLNIIILVLYAILIGYVVWEWFDWGVFDFDLLIPSVLGILSFVSFGVYYFYLLDILLLLFPVLGFVGILIYFYWLENYSSGNLTGRERAVLGRKGSIAVIVIVHTGPKPFNQDVYNEMIQAAGLLDQCGADTQLIFQGDLDIANPLYANTLLTSMRVQNNLTYDEDSVKYIEVAGMLDNLGSGTILWAYK